MKERTYDNQSYQAIKELIKNKNFSKAMALIKKVLTEYPLDIWTRLEYARILRMNQQLDEALEQALYLLDILERDKTDERAYEFTILELHSIYFLLNDYPKAYQYLNQVKEIREKRTVDDFLVKIPANEIFLKQRLGLLELKDVIDYQEIYLISQIVNYDKKRAINHIVERHHSDYPGEEDNYFEDDICIESIFDKVDKLLPTVGSTFSDSLASVFNFEYPDIPNVILKDGYPYKYLKVVAFRDTLQIITMYPYFSKERIEIVNSLKIEEKQKVKRMSQIEKFNNRYNKK